MDPCLPGVSTADARTIARVKLGVPPQYASKMTAAQVCNAMHLGKKTNIMPPMEYRTYKGKTYLIDPKSPLTIGDFVTFLQAKSVGEIAPVANKLKLVTEYVSKSELKANIIKILQGLNIAEPIEIPHRMKLKIGSSLNSTPINANLPANLPTANELPANANTPANANRTNGNANRANGNANRTNGTPLNLNASRNGLKLNQPNSLSSTQLNLNSPKPSELKLNASNAQSSAKLNLGNNPNPSGVSLTGNTRENSGVSLQPNATPSNVKLLSDNLGGTEGPPLNLSNPSPSGVSMNKYTNASPPLNLSRVSPSSKPSLSSVRSNNIASVVNDTVGKSSGNNNVSKALANLQKKLG